MHKSIPCALAILILGCGAVTAAAEGPLTLEQFLAQVTDSNPEIKSLDLNLKSMGLKSQELDMVYSPFVSGNYLYQDDRSGAGFGSSLPTDEMRGNTWSVTANKKFATGTALSMGLTNSSYAFDLLYPVSLGGPRPVASFDGYEIKPVIRLEQSLLRDFLYGVTQAGIDKTKATVRSGQYLQIFKRQQLLLNAQMIYWKLVLAQEVVKFRQTSLARTEKVLQWNQKRVGLDLADAGDLLQAQAAYKARQLNFQLAQEEALKAARDFNELLGTTATACTQCLETLAQRTNAYAGQAGLTRQGDRADVLAARAAYRSAEFANTETFFRSMPELSLAANYSLHGLAFSSQDAWDQVTNADKPTYSVALSCLIPLDIWTLANVRAGYQQDYLAAKENLLKAELSAQNDWADLTETWDNIRTRLALAQEVQKIQEQRLLNEQKRFQRGRSTTFQVLAAENDLDDAVLNMYRVVFEELVTAAQSELYNTRLLP